MKRHRIQVCFTVLILMAAMAGAGYAASVQVGIHIPELPQPASTSLEPASFPAWEPLEPVRRDPSFDAHWEPAELEPQLVWTVEGSVEELLVKIRADVEQAWQPVTGSSAIIAAGDEAQAPTWEIRLPNGADKDRVLSEPITLTLAAL